MTFLGMFLIWLGYVLVYAGIANHGRYAAQPWLAAFADAYEEDGGLNAIPGIGGRRRQREP